MTTKIYSAENVPVIQPSTQQAIHQGVVNIGGPDEVYVRFLHRNHEESPNLLQVLDEDDNILFKIDTEEDIIF